MGNTSTTDMNTGFAATSLISVYSGNYSTVVGDNTFNFSTPFYWNGNSNVVVNMCFDNGAATSGLDFMEGATAPAGATRGSSRCFETDPGPGCSLGAVNIDYDRIRVTFGAIAGNPVETLLNSNRTEYIGNNGVYNFYNGINIISKIENAAANLGCVSSTIFEAGNTWQSFSAGQRSQKVIEITPTTNSGSSYTVGIYYTLAELDGKTPSTSENCKNKCSYAGYCKCRQYCQRCHNRNSIWYRIFVYGNLYRILEIFPDRSRCCIAGYSYFFQWLIKQPGTQPATMENDQSVEPGLF